MYASNEYVRPVFPVSRAGTALDDAMPQREVVEERPQVLHQLQDEEAEDEQRHEHDPEEQEAAHRDDLQRAEDPREDQQGEPAIPAGDATHPEEDRGDRDEQEERDGGEAGDGGEHDDQEEVQEEPEGDEPADVAQRLADLRRLAVHGFREVKDRGDRIFHGARVAHRSVAVHDERRVWTYLMGSGRFARTARVASFIPRWVFGGASGWLSLGERRTHRVSPCIRPRRS